MVLSSFQKCFLCLLDFSDRERQTEFKLPCPLGETALVSHNPKYQQTVCPQRPETGEEENGNVQKLELCQWSSVTVMAGQLVLLFFTLCLCDTPTPVLLPSPALCL